MTAQRGNKMKAKTRITQLKAALSIEVGYMLGNNEDDLLIRCDDLASRLSPNSDEGFRKLRQLRNAAWHMLNEAGSL